MNKLRYSVLIAVTLLALGLLAPSGTSMARAGGHSPASVHLRDGAPLAQIQPWEQFRINMFRLLCNDANEEGFLQGDEPYLLMATVSQDALGVPVLGLINSPAPYVDVDAGEVRFPDLDLLNGHLNSSVVVVAQVAEDDGNFGLAVATAFGNALDAFDDAVNNHGIVNLDALGGIVGMALHDGVAATVDDPIGPAARFTITAQMLDALEVGQAAAVALQVSGNGATYTMHLRWARTR